MDTGTALPQGLVGPLLSCQGCDNTRWGDWTFDRMPLINYPRYRWTCPCKNTMTWCPATDTPTRPV